MKNVSRLWHSKLIFNTKRNNNKQIITHKRWLACRLKNIIANENKSVYLRDQRPPLFSYCFLSSFIESVECWKYTYNVASMTSELDHFDVPWYNNKFSDETRITSNKFMSKICIHWTRTGHVFAAYVTNRGSHLRASVNQARLWLAPIDNTFLINKLLIIF